PENNHAAKMLAEKMKALLQNALPGGSSINKYTKVEQSIPASQIEGSYTGYLIKYDYSGQHVVQSANLKLSLTYSDGNLTGLWSEDDSTTVQLKAFLTPKAVVFNNMHYQRT